MKTSFSKACFFFVMAAWLISCKTNSGSPVSPADNSHHHGGVLQPDSTVLEILSLTSADSLQYFVRELTGEQAVIIDGVADTIESRTRGSEGHLTAMKYISQKLQSYGLEVRLQNFFVTGTNVIATQPGTDFQNRKYLIGAHYDNRETNRLTVPGADDNASGVAAVLEAARLLSRHKPRYTIIYALWDQEELGLQGSGYFAVEAWSHGDSLLGVLNLDMIGWDSNNDGVVEIQSNLLPETRNSSTPRSNATSSMQSDSSRAYTLR